MLRIKGKTIGFRTDQLNWIKDNEDFEINKFCRDKLDKYMEQRNEAIE